MANIPLERSIVQSIFRRLNQVPNLWAIKTHGGAFGRVGVPDIVGCYFGRMFALEVKRPGVGVVAPKQRYELLQVANAGGLSAVVESVADVEELLGL